MFLFRLYRRTNIGLIRKKRRTEIKRLMRRGEKLCKIPHAAMHTNQTVQWKPA